MTATTLSNATIPRLRPGTALTEDCRVIRHLARSNVYDVYDAWSTSRACRVAVKVLRPDRAGDRRATAALLREGRLLATLAHPHLARAYEVHREPEPVVVLETLGGATLAAMIAERAVRTAARDAAVLGLHLCSAIAYLHGQGLLHLDLKPANVVADAGRGRVIDLGGARPPGAAPAGTGTWCYCAPEQSRGDDLTTAADVWGVGIILWEVVTGELAYGADARDDDHAAPQLVRRVDPVRQHRRLPAGLAEAIDAALELDPADRPSIRELARACELTAGLPPRERRLSARR
ncbi:MAG: serine/threonine protein kinase [Solirubrobacteraceae bacterium]|nr:serine/threonine protein kinase [Solirubrobacteraceae bacterium]